MRYLTEAQAWRKAAKLAQYIHLGLCFGISQLSLYGQRRISKTVQERMRRRLHPKLKAAYFGYVWPRTPDGYAERTAWAEQQASRAEREAERR